MRRLLIALTAALLVVGLLPLAVLAGVPVADGQQVTATEDVAKAIVLSASESTNVNVTAFSPGSPSHGALAVNGPIDCTGADPVVCTQEFTYTPDQDYFGSDSFTFTATSDTESPSATVDITVDPVNDAPSFTKGSNVVAPNVGATTRSGWATGISAGPGESDGLTFALTPANTALFASGPSIDSATGDLTFTPSGTTGSTSVQLQLDDNGTPPLSSGVQSFTITILDGPAADPLNVTFGEDSTNNTITLTGSDPQDDPLTFAVATQPAHGTLSGAAPDLSYTPTPDFFGTDTFTYTASDGTTTSPAATVSITVTSGNNDPVLAKSDFVTVKATTTTVLNPLANDSGGAGETLAGVTITAVSKPSKGSATITNAGTRVTYDPSGCATGSDAFTYTISDGGSTSTKSVGVTINRPGQGGLSTKPLTDTPAVGFITNSTMGSTVPMKLSWCGVTASSTSVRSYRVYQSTNGGSTYPTKLFDATTARSSTRSLSVSRDYRWKVRTLDRAGRAGAYRSSLVSRITRYQNTSSRITFTGIWGTHTTSSASGGSERYTYQAGATAEITVTNVRSFAIVGPKSSTRGSFTVAVDGQVVKTVSERATSTVYRRILYARGVTSGAAVSHTITITSLGGGRIDLDAVLTLSP